MPIGPIGQQPVNRIEDVPAEVNVPLPNVPRLNSQPQSVAQPENPTSIGIATGLVQNARAAKSSGNDPNLAQPLENLLGAVTSQMGAGELPHDDRQSLAAKLADDPVVKALIG